jgi:hypothetical protein
MDYRVDSVPAEQCPQVEHHQGEESWGHVPCCTCTFTITDSFEDPQLGLLTATVEGSVTGFVTRALTHGQPDSHSRGADPV